MTPRTWKQQRQVKNDKNQAVLAPNAKTGYKLKDIPIKATAYLIAEPVSCPFCLHQAKIGAFLITTKKGFHTGLGKCPECNNQMRLKTLAAVWTPEQFAEWAYDYSASGYWQKVPFAKFNDRLHKIGWSYRYWKRYKELKGEGGEENYDEQYEQYQREEHEAEMDGQP